MGAVLAFAAGAALGAATDAAVSGAGCAAGSALAVPVFDGSAVSGGATDCVAIGADAATGARALADGAGGLADRYHKVAAAPSATTNTPNAAGPTIDRSPRSGMALSRVADRLSGGVGAVLAAAGEADGAGARDGGAGAMGLFAAAGAGIDAGGRGARESTEALAAEPFATGGGDAVVLATVAVAACGVRAPAPTSSRFTRGTNAA